MSVTRERLYAHPVFHQNFQFEIYLYNQIQSYSREIMSARRQNNLATMRLSLLHPLGAMSHRATRGDLKKKIKLKDQ